MRLAAAVLGAVLCTSALHAQSAAARTGHPSRKAQAQTPHDHQVRRAKLEQHLREKSTEIVRKKLALSDAQMKQLHALNDRLAPKRRALSQQEVAAQQALRTEVARGDAANQKRVSQLMDQVAVLRKQQVELGQEEQKQLATFMTPVQRAKYGALQTELRRRMREIVKGKGENRAIDSALTGD